MAASPSLDYLQAWDWPGFQALELKSPAPVSTTPFGSVDRIFGWDSPEVGLRALGSYAAGQTPSYAELMAPGSSEAAAPAQPAGWPSFSLPDLSRWVPALQRLGIGLAGGLVALVLVVLGIVLWSRRS